MNRQSTSPLMAAFFLAMVAIMDVVHGQTVRDLMEREPMVAEFLKRIPKGGIGQMSLTSKPISVLAPTNEAVRRFEERKRQEGQELDRLWAQIYQYHFIDTPTTVDTMGSELLTEVRGSYPIYVTRREHHDRRQSEIYLNNARLIRSDIKGSFKDELGIQQPQVLHVIDEVLEPVLPRIRNNRAPDASLYNPSAWELLDKSPEYNLALTQWRAIVQERNMQDFFAGSEKKTYFIPIDSSGRIDKGRTDDLALAGHVIPGEVLFSRAMPPPSGYGQFTKFESGVDSLVKGVAIPGGRNQKQASKLKVMLSLKNITGADGRPDHVLLFAQSHTIVSDQLRKEGTVMVEIERANIPVKNGVVHLIKKPLLTVDESLTQLIEGNPDLKKFAEFLKTKASSTWNQIRNAKDGTTVLAPSNEAFNRMGRQTYNNLINNKQRVEQIASYHVLLEKFSARDALGIKKTATQEGLEELADTEEQENRMLQVKSASPDMSVWFHAFGPPDNITLSVDAAGVNGTIISPDLAATNGILYVIDHVLGIPYQTVFKKLSTDPMMKITYDLGTQRNFNEQMQDEKKRFTYFVPSNEAWEKQQSKYPSAMKKILMGAFPGNTKLIMERHLLINEALELDELAKRGKIQMARSGTIQVYKENAKQKPGTPKPKTQKYLVEWDGIVAEVERGDIECTNGYIHVIREVLMKDKDVHVNMATPLTATAFSYGIATIMSFLAAKLLSS